MHPERKEPQVHGVMRPPRREIDQLSIVDAPQTQVRSEIHHEEGAHGMCEWPSGLNRPKIEAMAEEVPQVGHGGEGCDAGIECGQDPAALLELAEGRAGEDGSGEEVEEAVLDQEGAA